MSEDKTQGMTLEAKVDLILVRLDAIDGRLAALEAKAIDTRPIWERALAEIVEINERLGRMDRRIAHRDDKIDLFIEEALDMRRDIRELQKHGGKA